METVGLRWTADSQGGEQCRCPVDKSSKMYSLRMRILNQNMRMDADSKFQDPHISKGLLWTARWRPGTCQQWPSRSLAWSAHSSSVGSLLYPPLPRRTHTAVWEESTARGHWSGDRRPYSIQTYWVTHLSLSLAVVTERLRLLEKNQ